MIGLIELICFTVRIRCIIYNQKMKFPRRGPMPRANADWLDIARPLMNTVGLMADSKANDLMERIVSLCKRRGFIFQSSEIYGGINGFWDYGPLGAELKRNVKDFWWRAMTQRRDDVVGLEATIIMHPKIWEASGHATTFADPMVDCLLTKKRFRADQIDPQSGIVYHYSGAEDSTDKSEKSCKEPYSVLLAPGKNPDSARKVARQFYAQRGIVEAQLAGRTDGEGGKLHPLQSGKRQPVDRGADVQFDVQDLCRPGGERGEHGLSAAGNGAGDFRAVQERGGSVAAEGAVRHLPDRQGVSQ